MGEKQVPQDMRPKTTEVILLVEPDDMVRNLAHMVLEEGGYTVLEARDGLEGFALCADHQGPIDLLVTNLMIRDLDGPELAERAIKLRPRLKVMFLAERMEDVLAKEEAIRAGTVVIKPFTPVGLAERVREVLESNNQSMAVADRARS
jgi:DNA-binding response OmpR family regulator